MLAAGAGGHHGADVAGIEGVDEKGEKIGYLMP